MSDRLVTSDCISNRSDARPFRILRLSHRVVPPAILAALIALPWYGDFGVQRLLVEVFTLFAIALAWNLLAGYGGLVAIGLHFFVGMGSYSLFAISNNLHLNPWFALPIATVCTAVVALVSAWPMFRLSGRILPSEPGCWPSWRGSRC
jgi:branched-chain amino acid transport system permease protein